MLSNRFLQLATTVIAGLPQLVAAGADPSPYRGDVGQQPLNPQIAVANGSSPVMGVLREEECDSSITACGTTADVKVVRTHNSTSYVTIARVFESVTTLAPSIVTVTEVRVETKTTSTEGQCRETVVIEETTPLVVTVDVNTTTIREFVPISYTTTISTKIVEHKEIAQCIIKTTRTSLVSAPSSKPTTDSAGSSPIPNRSPSSEPSSYSSSSRATGRSRSTSAFLSSTSSNAFGSTSNAPLLNFPASSQSTV